MSPDAGKGKGLIYWGNYDTNTITIYSAKGVNGKKKAKSRPAFRTPSVSSLTSKATSMLRTSATIRSPRISRGRLRRS